MKKIFLAMTCCLISLPASAGEFVYDYSGSAAGFYGYSDYSHRYTPYHKHHHTPVMSEISASVGYLADNATEFRLGADAQISDGKEVEDYNHGEWGENIYATWSGSYGELGVGQIYNAAYQLAVGAPSVGIFRVNNSPVTDFIANPNWQRHSRTASYRTLNSTFLNTDADAFKISYTTAEYMGTKAAFSYTPDSYSEAGLINKHSRYDNRSSYAVGLYNTYEVKNTEIESSLGYAYNRKNNQEISAGLSVYRKGWTLGGSYRKSFTSGNDYRLNLRTNPQMPEYFDGYRRGQAFNVGLGYEIGPFKTALSYFASYADKTDHENHIWSWANKFAVTKNVSLYAVGAYLRSTGDKKTAENNRGVALISGLELSF